MTRTLSRALLVVGLLGALAACGDDGGVSSGDNRTTAPSPTTAPATSAESTAVATTVAPTTAAPTTSAGETTTTAGPTTVVTTSPAPTTEAPPDGDSACGTLAPIPAGAGILGVGSIDWAGDGSTAIVTVYETAAGNQDYRLRIEEPGGGSEVALVTDGVVPPAYLGSVQVDFSLGSDQPQPEELLVTVGANAAGYNLSVFYKDDLGCLAQFKGADEAPVILPIHASVGTSSGVACEGAAGSQFLVRTTATASGAPNEYDTHDIRLRRTGDQLLDDVDVPGHITDDGTPTSPLLRYSSITNCPGVETSS